jgi:glutamate carboxypeptidase
MKQINLGETRFKVSNIDLLPTGQTIALARRIEDAAEALGQNVKARAVGYGSDGNTVVATGMQLLVGLGPYGGGMQSEREFMLLKSYPVRRALVPRFLIDLLSGKE